MSSPIPTKHIAQQLIDSINTLPLWVKHVIYLELQKELVDYFSLESLNKLTSEDTLAFFVPRITAEGEKMLLDLRSDVGKLLMASKQNLTVLDICLHHDWSLEVCCHHLMEAIRSQWIYPPASTKALGTIEYLSNSIRLGEYLVKMERITLDQLEQGLRTQQYIKESLQEHTGLANILINLGFITRQDTETILFLKSESQKLVRHSELLDKLSR